MPTPRETARSEVTAELLASARRQLAEVGPAALSLRAVARDIGMVSSAVYRYVASRDDLLTALIVQCYDELGAAVEEADRDAAGADLRSRWFTVCRTIRDWSAAHPHEYALLYGSPVPGYVAPQSTIDPATRPTFVLVGLVVEANRDEGATAAPDATYAPGREAIVELYRERSGDDISGFVDDDLVRRTIAAWTAVFGVVSFERFGHLVGSVSDYDAFFDDVVGTLADGVGLTGP